jgi:hypothetical protein
LNLFLAFIIKYWPKMLTKSTYREPNAAP